MKENESEFGWYNLESAKEWIEKTNPEDGKVDLLFFGNTGEADECYPLGWYAPKNNKLVLDKEKMLKTIKENGRVER